MLASENEVVRFMATRAFHDKRTLIGGNLENISRNYGLTIHDVLEVPKLMTFHYGDTELSKIAVIKELMNTEICIDIFAPLDMNSLIYFLCTNLYLSTKM